jgi:hypothetical protein
MKYAIEEKTLTDIGDKIRNYVGSEKIPVLEMPGKIEEACQTEYSNGKQAENEALFNAITVNGTRTGYNSMFVGTRWTDSLFKPNVVLKPQKANSMFKQSRINENLYTDNLDFSVCVDMQGCFSENSVVTRLKRIDARNVSVGWNGMNYAFMNCSSLESIDEFYPPNTAKLLQTFNGCYALKHITFMSDIKTSDLNLSSCTLLDKASISSVVHSLSDDARGLSVTLSRAAVNKAFETSEGANDGAMSGAWVVLIGFKVNWTISLV